jgi:PIN domain nuclease of toxin-antitoxin system
MNILVDTHILIWVLDEQNQLSKQRKELLEDYSNTVFLSQVSLMELVIKKSLNKLPDFVPDISEAANKWLANGYEILPIKNDHIFTYRSLPLFGEHKDPFDRFLISTAMFEQMDIMTSDEKFKWYSSLINIV